MTFITSERYKEELKRNLSFCHKFRSVPRSFQKELVPVPVPQKGTSSRNVRYLNEVLERTVQSNLLGSKVEILQFARGNLTKTDESIREIGEIRNISWKENILP